MKDANPNPEGLVELDLLEILREVYRRKWIVLAITLVAGGASALLSYTQPDIYESSAALIIRKPESAIDRDPSLPPESEDDSVMSVEALQLLTESTETMRKLFDSLWAEKSLAMWREESLDEEAAFRGFQSALSTEVRRQQTRRSGTSVELLPILVLRVRAGDPADAQEIANAWARIVETKSKDLFTQGVTAINDLMGDMYKQSSDTLARLEDELARKTLESNVALKTAERENLSLKIGELEGVILDLDIEIAVNAIAIQEGKRRILEQEYGGEWIGTVAESAAMQGAAYPVPADQLSDRAKRVLALAEQKVRQTVALREYRQTRNALSKETKLKHYQTDIERILTEKAKAEDELPSAEEALAALQKELEGMTETLVLDKAITDDALWDAAVNNPDARIGGLGILKSESVNPVYLSTKEMIVAANSRVETLRSGAAQYTKSADSVTALMESLETELAEIKQEVTRQENALKDTEANVTLLREDYLAEIKRVEEFESSNLRKLEEKKTREERLGAFEKQATTLESDLALAKLDLDVLSREVDKTKNVRTAIAGKAETAALLQVSKENASRTGTTIFYNAQADPNSLKLGGRKIVFATMLSALLLSCVAVAGLEVLRPKQAEILKPEKPSRGGSGKR